MNFPKVELHVHLDGAIRYETLLELSTQKQMDIGVSTVKELKEKLITTEPKNLSHVLEAFFIFLPVVQGDPDAIERIAYEFCEDQAKSGVIYFEGRYCPHLLANTAMNDFNGKVPYKGKGEVTPETVVDCVTRGFVRGEKDFNVKARQILCCIRAQSHWTEEVLALAMKSRNKGVVGIDIAGSAHSGAPEKFGIEEVQVFQEAKRLGIRRTVHAGESGAAEDVEFALKQLFAERIGHGYHVLDDDKIYDFARKGGYHFEVCPLSSIITGSVNHMDWKNGDWLSHPAVRFAKDKVNFSLNTDDPTCFGNNYNEEMKLAKEKFLFTDLQIWQCQLNAANSCFLPDDERMELVEKIVKAKPKD